MKRNIIYNLLSALLFGSGVLATSCVSDMDDDAPKLGAGCLTLDLGISDAKSRLIIVSEKNPNSDKDYNENTISTLDVYLYDNTNFTTTSASLFHKRITAITDNPVNVSINELEAYDGKSLRVIAVANYHEDTALPDNATVEQLSAIPTRTSEFRKLSEDDKTRAEAPADFVMQNFTQADNNNVVTLDVKNGCSTKVSLKRVAAKIRTALSIPETIEEEGVSWKPDWDDIRVFITNGVRKARLDGDGSKVELTDNKEDADQSDYYSIATSGQKETEDYYLARQLIKHEADELPNYMDAEYPIYNNLPLYTYPSSWEDSMLEDYQPMLIVVVPWESNSGGTTTYLPTYYKMPITKDTQIISNAYYYLRAHIGMLGSISPEAPMEVKMECEIAEWGQADETTADLRPIRYLIFNQKEFVLNNERSITIPFTSTHPCYNPDEVSNAVSVTYFTYYGYRTYGEEKPKPLTSGYTCTVDNEAGTLSFTHDFDYKYYSRFEVDITINHNDSGAKDAYKQTLHITVYPPIYLTASELIEGKAYNNNDGWILVNGYGTTNAATGSLGPVGNSLDNYESGVLLTLHVTQFNEEEAAKWRIGDPRKRYINNQMDDNSMKDDLADHTTIWTDSRGPYKGDSSNSSQQGTGEWKTIWEYYTGPDWTITMNDGTVWDAKKDTHNARAKSGLTYYYPTLEDKDATEMMIAPAFTMVSAHARAAHAFSKAEARRRCATYQQFGYPAGRWRLPTRAEIQIVKQLQEDKIMAKVFDGDNSWSANGTVNENGDYNNRSTAYVRCVYDSWYWDQVDEAGNPGLNRIPNDDGTKANWKIFTYGDRPKENPLSSTSSEQTYSVENFLKKHNGVTEVK